MGSVDLLLLVGAVMCTFMAIRARRPRAKDLGGMSESWLRYNRIHRY